MLPARGATFYAYRKRINSTFQSTLPARGATELVPISDAKPDFNPRSPHGERRIGAGLWGQTPEISIHAPRTGSDDKPAAKKPAAAKFQSTLPARGATRTPRSGWPPPCNFNPRSPHGERQDQKRTRGRFSRFQSTLPARGATISAAQAGAMYAFQSTLPARGATDGYYCEVAPTGTFQSTLPARGATCHLLPRGIPIIYFNPRSPHGERLHHG